MDDQIKQLRTAHADRVELVQVTDCHLYGEADGCLLGLPTLESFTAVMDSVRAEAVTPDLLLATGDLSQDATPTSYQRLVSGLAPLPYPAFWIAGNHDELPVMQQHLQAANLFPHKRVIANNWQIILLNSAVPHRVYGRLSSAEIKLLKTALAEFPDHHALIVLHHHPVNVDCFWLDTIGLNNPENLFDAIAGHGEQSGAKTAFLWGHIHQEFDRTLGDIRLLATPSTCVQFTPHTDDFQADTESPGYRVLTLHQDGRIDTQVRRIDHIEFTVDYSQKGY